MARRFYLSTRKDRSTEGDAVSGALRERGWICTLDWAALGHSESLGFPTIAQAEIEGIRQADVLIVLLPGGFGTPLTTILGGQPLCCQGAASYDFLLSSIEAKRKETFRRSLRMIWPVCRIMAKWKALQLVILRSAWASAHTSTGIPHLDLRAAFAPPTANP
jgi:hypothetical protein